MGEPHWVPLAELRQMTPYQTIRLVFHPRDENGAVEHTPRTQGAQMSPKDGFFWHWRTLGVAEWRIEEKYREWVKQGGG